MRINVPLSNPHFSMIYNHVLLKKYCIIQSLTKMANARIDARCATYTHRGRLTTKDPLIDAWRIGALGRIV